MKKAPIFGVISLLLIGLVAAGALAMPFGGFGKIGFGSNDAMSQAMQAGNYEDYMTALEDNWKTYKAEMTEEKFNQLAERHSQMADRRAAMQESHEQIQQAIEAGNYEAWAEAISTSGRNSRMAELITEENFNTYSKLHQARQNQDWESAKQLSEELGLEEQGCLGKGNFGRSHKSFRMHEWR